jgi:hypothetical protein
MSAAPIAPPSVPIDLPPALGAAPAPVGVGVGDGGPAPSVRDLVMARVRARARRRLAWLEHLRGRRVASGTVSADDVDLALENRDSLDAELAWRRGDAAMEPLGRAIADCERALEADQASRLSEIAGTFDLEPDELDVLHVCWSHAVDPALAKVWAYLHGHASQNYPSELLIARLCDHPTGPLAARTGALMQWEMVQAGDVGASDPTPLTIDPHLVELLAGRLTLDPVLVGRADTVPAREPPPGWPVQAAVARIRRVLGQGQGVRLTIIGPNRSGRRTLAACITAALGARVLGVDTTGLSDGEWTRVHLRAQRQALLMGASLVWLGERTAARFPASPGQARLQFIIGDVDLPAPAVVPGVVDERIVMPALSIDERRAAWRRLMPASQAWPEQELTEVVERYRVQIGDIAGLGEHGTDTAAEAKAGCRLLTRHRLGDLGQLIDTPFKRADLTLPPNVDQLLNSFLFEARERARFWENRAARRLFPRGTGLVALMTGSPGTGKTMTAQVVAAELGLDLVRIDLASTVNKYIGETAKNLRKIFARVAEMNAVLLFDEADALFAKRTDVRDAHDRHANADTNYLLQQLEDFDGIALLASNRKQNIDSAFVRRIRYIMDFPRPRAGERRQIWQRLTRELAGEERAVELDRVLGTIADLVDLSGAQIKLALLGAIFCAREAGAPLGLDHLYIGMERELAKEGRNGELPAKEKLRPRG